MTKLVAYQRDLLAQNAALMDALFRVLQAIRYRAVAPMHCSGMMTAGRRGRIYPGEFSAVISRTTPGM
jgi:hypothetical protein